MPWLRTSRRRMAMSTTGRISGAAPAPSSTISRRGRSSLRRRIRTSWRSIGRWSRLPGGSARPTGRSGRTRLLKTPVPRGAGIARPHASPPRSAASPAATVAASRHDLTPWIENPQGYDPAEALAPSPLHWLIYFPAAESEPAYAELSERAARIFGHLGTPTTAAGVASALGGLSAADALTAIDE